MTFPAAVAFVCTLWIVCARGQEGDDVIGESTPCDTQMFANLDSCCETPRLLPLQVMQDCMENMGKPRPGDSQVDFQSDVTDDTAGEFASGAGGPILIIECIFSNQSMLTRSGLIDVNAIFAKFSTAVDSVWRPVVKSAMENCTVELSRFKVRNLTEAALGNLAPALLMSCVRRSLTLSCPESSLSKTDASCPQKFAAVRNCEAFSLGTGPQGGSGGWFGGVLRWIAGPSTWGQKRGPGKESSKGFFLMPMFRMMFPFG